MLKGEADLADPHASTRTAYATALTTSRFKDGNAGNAATVSATKNHYEKINTGK